jgi:hypothetical protein
MTAADGHLHPSIVHYEMLPECIERNKRVEGKLDDIKTSVDKMASRTQSFIDDAIAYHARIMQIERRMDGYDADAKWFKGILVSIVLVIVVQIGGFLFLWGQMTNQVQTNTHRWEALISSGTHGEIK